ncbi:L-threonylcarbamoyladenylate synthase [Desulfobaculum xiamenense]|uniref:L-threonylcarbamoyladenylate synthase n=1 Tax=Desulfobaculum xiamenense TaxID=995050 RepID=A0A846QLM9_9BACT|nr:L-threonylcarbamoyladenylate synthase [Desulfobaculum xiamenense]NJB67103.1 L-threonylcarbamoyladenylate synthase [Desulfobaculum xiamenense]
MNSAMERACRVILDGGVLVYPTETLYAIGCDGLDAAAAARVYALKGRDPSKPLPLLVADAAQLSLVTDWSPQEISVLAEHFWPGPLSVLVPARAGLPAQIQDRRGLTSVRVTPHPVAAELSRRTGRPIVATSANISGQPAVCVPGQLDAGLCAGADFVLDERPWPAGGLPSTVVGVEGEGRLAVYREGAVSVERLEAVGFTVRRVI